MTAKRMRELKVKILVAFNKERNVNEMRRGRPSKYKFPTKDEIDIFCQSTEEIIAKIYERCEIKKSRKRRKKTDVIHDEIKVMEEVA